MRGVTRALRATGEDYTRLFAMVRWPALLGGLILLALAVGIVVQGPTEQRVVGPVPAGSPVTSDLSGSVAFDVFVSTDAAQDVVCRDGTGKQVSTLQFPIPDDRVIDGAPWFGTGARVELREGESTTCAAEGADVGDVLLVHRTGLVRVLQAALFGGVGLVGLGAWWVGTRAARRLRTAAS